MKIHLGRSKSASGGILLVAIVVVGVMGFAMMAYLRFTQQQYQFTMRSQAWNNCLPVVEAGIEETLMQLNKYGGTNLSANGWTAITGGFKKTREIGDGYYDVKATYTNLLYVTITATGFVPAPILLGANSSSSMFAAAAATPFVPDPKIRYISRTVEVQVKKEPALMKGMVVRQGIDLGGNKCHFDSFDSRVGPYNAATAGDKGDVVINEDITGSAGIGNADIKGHLYVGPKAKLSLGPNGTVGSVAWHAAGNHGIQTGWLRRDMNVSIPDVKEPWTDKATTPTGNGGAKYVLDDGNYELGSLNVGGSDTIHVKGNAVLYVKGNISISGQLKINSGNKLTIYCGGTQINLSGTYDKSDLASEFSLFGLPSVKEVNANGVALALYAPNAELRLNGGGQFYGSSVTKSVKMNGHTSFHYDEALGGASTYRQYVISSWNEI